MCLTCGCNDAHDQHDDKRHITYEMLADAARAEGITVNDAIKNLNKAAIKDRTKHEDEYDTKLK
jgi:hypothetical protein